MFSNADFGDDDNNTSTDDAVAIIPPTQKMIRNNHATESTTITNTAGGTNTNFALVPQSSVVVIEHVPEQEESTTSTTNNNNNSNNNNNNVAITSIYEQYSILYPNAALIREYQDRDYLVRALMAADEAKRMQTLQQQQQQQQEQQPLNQPLNDNDNHNEAMNNKKGSGGVGFFGRLFGSSSISRDIANGKQKQKQQRNGVLPPTDTMESRLEYNNYNDSDDNDNDDELFLCGTTASLDPNVIPIEAHAVARYHMASSYHFCHNNNNVAASSNNKNTIPTSSPFVVARTALEEHAASSPTTGNSSSSSSILIITGLGEIMELKASHQNQQEEYPSTDDENDRHDDDDNNNNSTKNRCESSKTRTQQEQEQQQQIQYTSDREELYEQLLRHDGNALDGKQVPTTTTTTTAFRLEYTRAALIGSNFLVISWGFTTSRVHVTLYRRIIAVTHNNNNDGKKKDGNTNDINNNNNNNNNNVSWQAVGFISPSPAVLLQQQRMVDDIFAGDDHDDDYHDGMLNSMNASPMLGITDIVPIVLYRGDISIPAVTVAISRLGGFIEIIPIPSQIWYGPELIVPPHHNGRKKKQTKKKTKKHNDPSSSSSYLADLPNIAMLLNPTSIVAITTCEYHDDIMGMDILHTTTATKETNAIIKPLTDNSTSSTADYDYDDLPAEHVLVAYGRRNENDHETISFWSVNIIFVDDDESDNDNSRLGYVVKMKIAEALDLGWMGPPKTIFATETIMKHWRKPRQVALKQQPPSSSQDAQVVEQQQTQEQQQQRVTTISVSVPIVSVKFIRHSNSRSSTGNGIVARAALLDANGGATILDFGLLYRSVTQTLTDDDKYVLLGGGGQQQRIIEDVSEVEAMVPLVEVIHSRSYTLQQLTCDDNFQQPLNNGKKKKMKRHRGWIGSLLPPKIIDLDWLSTSTNNNRDHRHNNHIALAALVSADGKEGIPSQTTTTLRILMDDFGIASTSTSSAASHSLVMETSCLRTVRSCIFHRFTSGNILYLALSSSSISHSSSSSKTLHLCAVQEVHPRDIIQSLARAGKFKEALDTYNSYKSGLSVSDHDALKSLIEQSKKQLWETRLDFSGLETIQDEPYLVSEVVSMIEISPKDESVHKVVEKNEIELFQAACRLVLKRAKTIRMASSLAIGGGQGIHVAVAKIRYCLIRLGTYQILCDYMSFEPCLEHFIRVVLPVSINDLAISFAKQSLIVPLSIICCRHSHEVFGNLVVLNFIPLSVPPTKYQHLLPVQQKIDDGNKVKFICSKSKSAPPTLLDFNKFSDYLRQRFEASVFLDEDDKRILVEENQDRCNNDSTRTSPLASLKKYEVDQLENWYVDRTRLLTKYVSTLDHTYAFARTALFALHVHLDEEPRVMSPTMDNARVHELYRTMRIAEVLRTMSADDVGRKFSVHPSHTASAVLILEDFDRLGILDLISIVFDIDNNSGNDGWIGALDIGIRYDRYLRPLLEQKMIKSTTIESELNSSMILYCSNLIRRCTYDSDVKNNKLFRALSVCRDIAKQSRASTVKSKRIVKNWNDVIHFITSIIEVIPDMFRYRSFTVGESRQFIDILWTMYEALPALLPTELGISSEESAILSKRMDNAYRELVVLDILSHWPNSKGVSLICSEQLSSSMQGSAEIPGRHERIISSLCDSFCTQVGHRHQHNSGDKEGSDLMVFFLSDIDELNRSFRGNDNGAVCWKTSMVERLVRPLLLQQHIHLLGEFLACSKPEYIDLESISQEVSLYFNDIVHGSGTSRNELDNLRSAIDCQEILSRFLPSLRDEFQSIRKFVDAAHFINSVLFFDERTSHVRPTELRKEFSFDVIESVLALKPELVILDDEQWDDPAWAAASNRSIRRYLRMKSKPMGDPTGVVPTSELPPLPGQAIYRLAQILGLEDQKSVIAVKTRVVHYALLRKKYGAAAAVCRSLFSDLLSARIGTDEAYHLFASLVSSHEYEDSETKRELCNCILTHSRGRISVKKFNAYEQIVKISNQLKNQQLLKQPRTTTPFGCIGNFFHDSYEEYSVGLANLFTTLQLQSSDSAIDDSLLNALSSYSMFWCIARSTRPKSEPPSEFDKSETQSIIVLGAYLILLIRGDNLSMTCVREIIKIFEDQKRIALNSYLEYKWIKPDPDIVTGLIGRGYTECGARRAAVKSNNAGFHEALQWAVTHSLDAGFDNPLVGVKSTKQMCVDHDSIIILSHVLHLVVEILSGKRTLTTFLESLGLNMDGVLTNGGESSSLLSDSGPSPPCHENHGKSKLGVQKPDASLTEMDDDDAELGWEWQDESVTENEDTQNHEASVVDNEDTTKKSPEPADVQMQESAVSNKLVVNEAREVPETESANNLGHKVVMLISTQAFNREVTAQQERAFTILKALNIEYEALDAADKEYRGLRDELVSISGVRGKYPQFFLVDLSDGEATFWGGWERFEQANDDRILVDEFCHKLFAQSSNVGVASPSRGKDLGELNAASNSIEHTELLHKENQLHGKVDDDDGPPVSSVSQPNTELNSGNKVHFTTISQSGSSKLIVSPLNKAPVDSNESAGEMKHNVDSPTKSSLRLSGQDALNTIVDSENNATSATSAQEQTKASGVAYTLNPAGSDTKDRNGAAQSCIAAATGSSGDIPSKASLNTTERLKRMGNSTSVTPTGVNNIRDEIRVSELVQQKNPPIPPSGSPERFALLAAGQKIFAKVRQSSSPSAEERQKLIQQGRRLLQMQREAASSIMKGSSVPGSKTTTKRNAVQSGTNSVQPLVLFQQNGGPTSSNPRTAKDREIPTDTADLIQPTKSWDFDDDDISL